MIQAFAFFFLKGKHNVDRKVRQVGLNNCCIFEVSIRESLFVVYNSNSQQENLQGIETFTSSITIIPVSGCFYTFEKEKARLKKIGLTIPDFDLLIGVTAICYDLTLITLVISYVFKTLN